MTPSWTSAPVQLEQMLEWGQALPALAALPALPALPASPALPAVLWQLLAELAQPAALRWQPPALPV